MTAIAVSLPAATLPRTFVAHNGNAGDDCSRAHPCLTFSGAAVNTSSGGEIDVLDSGEYGPLTTSQDLTIDGLGNIAVGSNITADVGNLTMRNIKMESTGILILGSTFSKLRLEHVVIRADTTGGGNLDTGVKTVTRLC